MPCEPSLRIIVALDVPVAPTPGTLGAKRRKQDAAQYANEEERQGAQENEHADVLGVRWLLDEPCYKTEHNASNYGSAQSPMDALEVLDGQPFYACHIGSELLVLFRCAHIAL